MSKIYRPVIPIWIEEEDMRLIDADVLIESVCHTADLGGWIGDALRNIKRLAVRYINSAPTIDAVEVVHGEWKGYNADDEDWLRKDGTPIFLVCNKCYGTVLNNGSAHWNFCPNCGAKMDGGTQGGRVDDNTTNY